MIKYYTFTMNITVHKDTNTQITKVFKNSFSSDGFAFDELYDFMGTIKTAIKSAVDISKKYVDICEIDFSAELSVLSYIDNSASYETYGRWYADSITDVNNCKGEESLYLRPDTRYVYEGHDMLLTLKNLLTDITC